MKRRFPWFLIATLAVFTATAEAGDDDSSGSPSYTEKPMYRRSLAHQPGMTFDVPKDMQVTQVNGIFKIESPEHYLYRKIEAQDAKIEALAKRLEAAEEKIKPLEP